MQPSNKLIRSQKTMEGSYNYYMWCPENTFQNDVDQTTYLIAGRSPRVSMNHTRQYSSNPFGEGTLETGTKVIDTMKEQKRNKWEEVITWEWVDNNKQQQVIMSTDLTHNSRKAWQTIRKLCNNPTCCCCLP